MRIKLKDAEGNYVIDTTLVLGEQVKAIRALRRAKGLHDWVDSEDRWGWPTDDQWEQIRAGYWKARRCWRCARPMEKTDKRAAKERAKRNGEPQPVCQRCAG